MRACDTARARTLSEQNIGQIKNRALVSLFIQYGFGCAPLVLLGCRGLRRLATEQSVRTAADTLGTSSNVVAMKFAHKTSASLARLDAPTARTVPPVATIFAVRGDRKQPTRATVHSSNFGAFSPLQDSIHEFSQPARCARVFHEEKKIIFSLTHN